MGTREKVLETVKNILVGPNPLAGFTQENGEEILFCDSPLKTYVTGVLFPQVIISEGIEEPESEEENNEETEADIPYETIESSEKMISDKNNFESLSFFEEETSKINNFHQSAMGITLCVSENAEYIEAHISAGSYTSGMSTVPIEKKDVSGNVTIVHSEKQRKCYFRKQNNAILTIHKDKLPSDSARYKKYQLENDNGEKINGLELAVTFRMKNYDKGSAIYTITLINTKKCTEKNIDASDCWFQCGFNVESDKSFLSLPANFCADIQDDDYQLNALLYHDVKTYAIGHGCAATWEDNAFPKIITASVMPEYEVKPIIPTKSDAELSMKMYASNDKEAIIADIQILCDEYRNWIVQEEAKIANISGDIFRETAKKQIELCKECLKRMENGVELLNTKEDVLEAFRLTNRAMLLQQLHYRLPLTEFERYDNQSFSFVLKYEIRMPDFDDESTWYNKDKIVYGKWRPFQLAFILLNLNSIYNDNCPERNIVDLIWFPTGGGKTEAYLGLTAFTIFMRRIKNPKDSGTAVIMRYTLRLLTAQQYERAASLICAMEKLRSENEEKLGKERITIGLWVGQSLTENKSSDVIDNVRDIQQGKSNKNVSVMLKCPWCGASMETFKTNKTAQTPGYEICGKRIAFKCGNENCDFGKSENFDLPLNLFDDEIYATPPTLLFGTVDKFAILPFTPEAKSLFGGDGERTPPELIIQDELHLITGPLGSTVGIYETLINELCVKNGKKPKIITSTATISHAKQQCNALYACGEDNVFQFPVQGITYRDCFFAKEDKERTGRKYVGLYGSAASSSATASIYTFAAFLYAAKAVVVEDEKLRDPYWTNLAYFGSMRELGQAATWFIADIKEHLEVIYRSRLQSALSVDKRRYLYESGLAELTSRMQNNEIPKILKNLEVKYGETEKRPLDICLATNMISVGVDIPRLGLMTVTGQPKSMSEYIQATSRVGRDTNAPGLVFVIYNTSKSRDKSHYEKFQSQHSKLYCNVEPTSVTPFSRPLRERALPAIFAALHRFFMDKANRNDASRVPTEEEFNKIVDVIVSRADNIDKNEVEDIKKQLRYKLTEWENWSPELFDLLRYRGPLPKNAPLLWQAGSIKPSDWENRGWNSPTSMRNVDRECGLDCSINLIEEDNNE